jgi:hypothetical protein
MAKLDAEDFLAAWQVLWGNLDKDWQDLFLKDPRVEQIISYESETIYVSLKKFRKLSEVLKDIEEGILSKANQESEIRKANEELIALQDEYDRQLEIRKQRELPKPVKPDPRTMTPPEPVETTMYDLRHQPDKRHWW